MHATMKIQFEGFWQCRLSTDPDPTREKRGTSGYTVALPREPPFDRVVRTQRDQLTSAGHELRQPFPPYKAALPGGGQWPFGVFVTSVEGAPDARASSLLVGAELRLMQSPQFELRNQIVGDGVNRIAPPIVPFDVQIGSGPHVHLRRSDPLDPAHPEKEIWELPPDVFAARVPVTYRHLSDEVVDTIFPGTTDANAQFIAYFNQRKQWLEARLSAPDLDPAEAAGYRTRASIIDSFTASGGSDPGLIEDRLGLQAIWDHPIRGNDAVVSEPLAALVETGRPWHTRFWMGGWDGDLMIGWMQGSLQIPLRIHSS